jgi:hypothetical protein
VLAPQGVCQKYEWSSFFFLLVNKKAMSASDIYEMIDAQTRAKRKQLPTLQDYNFRDTLNNARATYREIYENPYKEYLSMPELQPVYTRLPPGSQFGKRVTKTDSDKFTAAALRISQDRTALEQSRGTNGFEQRERDLNRALKLMSEHSVIRNRQADLYDKSKDQLVDMLTDYLDRNGVEYDRNRIQMKNKSEIISILEDELQLTRGELEVLETPGKASESEDDLVSQASRLFSQMDLERRPLSHGDVTIRRLSLTSDGETGAS